MRSLDALKRLTNFKPTGRVGSWYSVQNMSTDLADISIYDEIGLNGVTATDFVNELRSVAAHNINLRINSPGGSVFDGIAILNSLRSHPANIHVVVEGIAASSASFIAMAGDSIEMAPQSVMMIHDAHGVAMGNAADMRSLADLLDKTSENIASVYAQRTGKPTDHWRQAMQNNNGEGTWYSDQEAVDAGLADRIVSKNTDAGDHTVTVVSDKSPDTVNWDDIDINVDELVEALKGVN